MSASINKRNLHYLTFGNEKFAMELEEFYNFAIKNKISVKSLFKVLIDNKFSFDEFSFKIIMKELIK
jgi:hypothetical protein